MTRTRSLLKRGGALAAVLALAAAADATIVEPYRMTVSEVQLPAGPLSAALSDARIAHLSDLHVRGMGLRERRLLSALHRSEPDLILMTGDYADTDEGVRALGEIFSDLRPRLGILAVPGNNDYYRGRQGGILSTLEAAGVRVLRNEAVTLEGDGGPFVVAGVDDPFFGRDDLQSTVAHVEAGLPAILLSHSPSIMLDHSEAMLFNAGDADGPWGRGWFWTDGSHFRGPLPAIRFSSSGPHTVRLQRREDGAGLGAIRLVPGGRPSEGAARGLQGAGKQPPEPVPGTIEIDPCAALRGGAEGSWRRESREGGGCYLADEPDKGVLASYPVAEPEGGADLEFDAPAGVTYRVWVEIHSPTVSGLSDSFYLQWDDAVDASGSPRYRIGSMQPRAAGGAFDLVLAGHTHGGQVRIPWFGPLERMLTKGPYVMGRYEVGGTMLYVSRGIGTSYLPVRFFCAPEIVLLSPPGASRS